MMQALRPRDSHRGNLGGYQLQDEDDDSQQVTSSALQGISRTAATQQQRFFHMPRFQTNFQKQQNYFNVQQFKQHLQQMQGIEFDGKRLRKAVARKTVDYNSSILQAVEARVWQRDFRDRRAVQPDVGYYTELIPPVSMIENPINAVTTKFVRTSTNKMRCPIFCVAWTPEGRRLVTGASSGEFTLWNGLTFNFETILQAHDSPVRCMMWSHSDVWMVTGDHAGYVKYWQSNMNNVKMFQAHKEPLRGIRWESWTPRPFIVHYQTAGNSELTDHGFCLLSVLSFTLMFHNFIFWCWCLRICIVFHGLYHNFISHATETILDKKNKMLTFLKTQL